MSNSELKSIHTGRQRYESPWGRGNRGDIQLQNRLRYGVNTWNRQELHRKLDGNSNRWGRRGRKNRNNGKLLIKMNE